MTVSKRSSTEVKAEPSNKRARFGKNSAPPPVVSDKRASLGNTSSKYAFLDDTTGFGGGLNLRVFIHPEAAKLYTMVRVRPSRFTTYFRILKG